MTTSPTHLRQRVRVGRWPRTLRITLGPERDTLRDRERRMVEALRQARDAMNLWTLTYALEKGGSKTTL